MAHTYEFPRPAMTADVVVFAWIDDKLQLMLIRRGQDPFKGQWAFPGGFMDMDETPDICAARELEEETGLKAKSLHEIGIFGRVDRDPRGRTVSSAYWTLFKGEKPEVKADSDADEIQWFAVDALPELAFDHDEMSRRAMSALIDYLQLAILRCELSFDLAENEAKEIIKVCREVC